jgi:hypothetical protein
MLASPGGRAWTKTSMLAPPGRPAWTFSSMRGRWVKFDQICSILFKFNKFLWSSSFLAYLYLPKSHQMPIQYRILSFEVPLGLPHGKTGRPSMDEKVHASLPGLPSMDEYVHAIPPGRPAWTFSSMRGRWVKIQPNLSAWTRRRVKTRQKQRTQPIILFGEKGRI